MPTGQCLGQRSWPAPSSVGVGVPGAGSVSCQPGPPDPAECPERGSLGDVGSPAQEALRLLCPCLWAGSWPWFWPWPARWVSCSAAWHRQQGSEAIGSHGLIRDKLLILAQCLHGTNIKMYF